ncbi:MAG: class I adenylate-forming enzyme family protein [Sporichthyaceae bacterium]
MNGPGQILPLSAKRWPAKTALITATRSLTYAELDEASTRVACGLLRRGVRPGRVVSLFGPNSWQWIAAYHGILKAGAIVNPINSMLTPPEVAYILGDAGASAILTASGNVDTVAGLTADLPDLGHVISLDAPVAGRESMADLLASSIEALPEPPDPTATSTIGYTSGTTGHPKGAVQTQRAVLFNSALTASAHSRTEFDVCVSALPAPHVYGNVVVQGTFMSGGTLVLHERYDPESYLESIGRYGATIVDAVPAMYATMLAAGAALDRADLSRVTRSVCGGQTIPISTIEAWEARSGSRFLELWGMTELSGPATSNTWYMPPARGSVGQSFPGTEVRIASLDDVSVDAPEGEPGELMCRGPLVMTGYFNNAEATKLAIEPDGWLHTGDIARKDSDGNVWLVDRRNDMIITGAYNVYPAEIERVMAAHPAIALVAVGSVPDEVRGELACAYVVLREGASVSAAELIEFTKGSLAPYKRPRLVRFVTDLPKTSTNKIQRRRLREFSDETGAAPAQGPG